MGANLQLAGVRRVAMRKTMAVVVVDIQAEERAILTVR